MACRRSRTAGSAVCSMFWPDGLVAEAVLGPAGVGAAGGQLGLVLLVVDHALVGGHVEHLPRAEAAALDLAPPVEVDGAGLRAAHDEAVVAHRVAQRAQAVAVEGGADADAVGEDDAGRTVPGLHQRCVVPVEALDLRGDVALALPGLGDGHGHGVADVAPAPGEQLDDRVELAGVGVLGVEDRAEQLLGAEAGGLGAEGGPGPHAVQVAGHGVDLAVVAQGAEGLGPLPRRQGVGGEALVEDGEGGLEALVGQVQVVAGQGVGGDEALVDDGAERARGHVGAGGGGGDAPAQAEGGPLVGHAVGLEDGLEHLGLGRSGQLAQDRVVGGRDPPLDHPDALGLGRFLDRGPGVVAPHEQHGQAPALAEDGRRDGDEEAGAVGGPGVGRHRAPVLHTGQATKGGGHDVSRRPAGALGDEADTAGVKLSGGTDGHASPRGVVGCWLGTRGASSSKSHGEEAPLPLPR